MNHLTGTEHTSVPLRHRAGRSSYPLDRFPLAGVPGGQDTAPRFSLFCWEQLGLVAVNPFLHMPPVWPLQLVEHGRLGRSGCPGAVRVPQAGTLRSCRPGKPLCRASQAAPPRSVPAWAAFPGLAALRLLIRKCLSFTELQSSFCRWLLTRAGLRWGEEDEPGAGGVHQALCTFSPGSQLTRG